MPQKPLPSDLFTDNPLPSDLFKDESSSVEPSWYDDVASYIPQPVKSGWNMATKPLTDYITDSAGNKIIDPKAAADYYDVPSEDDWKIPFSGGATWKGLGAGMLEGAGDLVTGLSSPLNLATAGAFKGASALEEMAPMASKGLQMVGRGLSAPVAAHGAATALNPNASVGERLFGVAEAAAGGSGMAHSPHVRMPGEAEPLPVKQAATPQEIPVVNRSYEAADYAMDNAWTKAHGGEVHPQLEELAKPQAQEPVDPRTPPFDPASIQYPKQEVQFHDPVTGKIKPASEAKAGDIPNIPEQVSNRDMFRLSEEIAAKEKPPPTEEQLLPHEFSPDMPQENATYEAPPEKPRSATKRGNFSSGETITRPEDIIGMSNDSTMPTGRASGPTAGKEVRLPAALRNAKPTYSHQGVQFASDLDKAAYIIARESRKSKYDHLYLKYVMEQTGLDEAGARSLGRQVKASIKQLSSGDTFEDISLPPTARNLIQQRVAEGAGKSNLTPEQKIQGLSERVKAAEQNPPSDTVVARELKNAVEESEKALAESDNEHKPGVIRRALQLQRAWLTAADLGAPGRQGKAFMLNKEWFTSLHSMVKAWGSEGAAKIIDQSIEEHPSGFFKHKVSETGKIEPSWAEKVAKLDLPAHEEVFNSKIGADFRKYSGINKASRAHTAFLNKLRSDMFVKMMKSAEDAGLSPKENVDIARKYATFINNATGRGSLNIGDWQMNRVARAANDVMFAPKNMSGQIRTWGALLDPRVYGNADPVMRKQALKSLFAIAGLGTTVSTLSQAAGAKVSFDPSSSDFLKMQFGRTRLDPFGGYQQIPVAAVRTAYLLANGALAGKKTKFGRDTAKDSAERYLTNRLSPAARFVFDVFDNKMFNGMPFDLQKEMYEQVSPIAASEILDVLREDPVLGLLIAPSTTLGLTGGAVYRDRKTGR